MSADRKRQRLPSRRPSFQVDKYSKVMAVDGMKVRVHRRNDSIDTESNNVNNFGGNWVCLPHACQYWYFV